MENIMLKKENGNLIESKRVALSSEEPYISNEEKCLEGMINASKVEKSQSNQIVEVKKVVNNILGDLVRSGNLNAINNAMNILKNVDSKRQLIELVKVLVNEYEDTLIKKCGNRRENIKESIISGLNFNKKVIEYGLAANSDLVISMMVKKLVIVYYFNKLLGLKKEKVSELQNQKANGVSSEKLLADLGEEFSEKSISNGVYSLSKNIFADQIDVVFDHLQTHLCWEDCAKASPIDCPKIRDLVKRTIDKYDFIKDGYQLISADGTVDTFVVTRCDKYRREIPKRLTTEEKKKIEQMKKDLRMAYFDADTIEEAYLTQAKLLENGHLKNPRGRVPSKKMIDRIKSGRGSKN